MLLLEGSYLGELAFIGMGLYDEKDISLRGMEELRVADKVFVELYTSHMAGLSIANLERLCGKPVTVVSRREVEEEEGKRIIEASRDGRVAFLVPGEPMVATTHVALRIKAEKEGIKTRIIHSSSIISAAISLSGLQSYKFGRNVTIPFPEERVFSEVPYQVIAQNRSLGLHTLCLLDVLVEKGRFMTVSEGLTYLLELERIKKGAVLNEDTLAVGIARAGSPNPEVHADSIEKLRRWDFGPPPHSIVIPGNLHFMEAEALITLAGAPVEVTNRLVQDRKHGE
ncbi:diphthine synthase [Candidatus Bathyarchaeota archaeon B24-2]|nr:MAG: diphthine synthase [Candidatus Bathyarchaeota archaeon B24-2]